MKAINQLNKRSENLKHRQELKNLKAQHENELEKLKINHEKYKNQIKTNHTLEKSNLYSDQKIKMARQADQNEKTLNKLRNSLNEVKEITSKEKKRILSENEKQLKNLSTAHETLVSSKKIKNEHLLQDMDHEAKIQINKLQRKINAKESELKGTSTEKLNTQRVINEEKLQTNKNIYAKKELAQTDKFQRSLLNQSKQHNKRLADTERKHQSQISKREKNYKNEVDLKTKDHLNKLNQLNKSHQEKYSTEFSKNEKIMQRLIGKKEKIISQLRQMVKHEAIKEMEMNKDSFYHYTGIEPKITLNQKQDGYSIKFQIPEYEAKNVKVVGFNREIKLTMDRDFDYTKKLKNGGSSVVKKSETLTSKIPVEYIVNPKTVTRSYNEGVLTFDIKFA